MSNRRRRGEPQPGNARTPESLAAFVGETYALMAKTQAAHWNATGPGFFGLHALTEAQYREIFAALDVLAERLRALGAPAPAGLAALAELGAALPAGLPARVAEAAAQLAEDNAWLARRAARLAEAAEAEDDPATHDLLVARIAAHEKAAWLYRSQAE